MRDRVVGESSEIKSFVDLFASAWGFLGCLVDSYFQDGVSSFLFHMFHCNALCTMYEGQGCGWDGGQEEANAQKVHVTMPACMYQKPFVHNIQN